MPSDPQLRQSPLDDRHRALDATMTGFGGWDMPLDYGTVVAEHRAVREGCGVFDLSHLGTLRVTGPGAESTLQQALTNDVSKLVPGRAHYTLCLDGGGGITDDLLVYRLDWGFFVVPNAANASAVRAAIDACGDRAERDVADVKADLACLAIQGPDAADVVTAAGVDVSDMAYLDVGPLELASPDAEPGRSLDDGPVPGGGVLARSGYTGERGYELFCDAAVAGSLWDRVLAAGAAPAGLGARDTLRLEMGYPLHGQDISPATSPVDARLGWAVKPGTGFTGEDAYVAAKEAGPQRRLRGLRVLGRGIPRARCTVRRDGSDVGETTSGTFSPTLRLGIALGYLDPAIQTGDRVEIDVRGKSLPAEVVRPPFVDRDPKA
ncbi:glycine cleavage system aminomethyltransferase GcvT [soil metagenome]